MKQLQHPQWEHRPGRKSRTSIFLLLSSPLSTPLLSLLLSSAPIFIFTAHFHLHGLSPRSPVLRFESHLAKYHGAHCVV